MKTNNNHISSLTEIRQSPWSLHLLPTPEPEPAWRLVQVVYIPDSISIVNGNSTFQLDMRGFWNITGVSLETSCPDCLVMSQSAPAAALACEDLLKPMDPPRLDQQLLRKWALVAGSLSHPASLESLKTRDGIAMEFSPSTPNTTQNSNTATTVHYTQTNRFGSRCESLTYNISLINDNSTFQFDVGGRFNLTGVFLETSCPDCLVMKWEVSSRRRESTDLYLLRKTEGGREVEEEEMEEFRKQVECMGLPPPVVMEPGDALCGSYQLPWKH
ncbi:uncharacterized protein LOC135560152 [Oncorhynchus nerka]|uniref:uncharacterized protein LOC135560152 n=1 Tax=Oncorhynchus nerka TaxID=8023 RepID=UPI0031B829E1